MSDLVKRGHDQAAELKASCGAVDVRDVAQLISDLATQLDVQIARSNQLSIALEAAEKRIAELEELEELLLRAKALMHQSGGTPIENSLNPVDAWLYDAEHAAAAGKGE
ncbi:hypothetical protein NOX44_004048 [Enterobacter hormaechei]|nr:hypothetical protein [Enterobacter hormaechei]